jgi:HSP20 family protein
VGWVPEVEVRQNNGQFVVCADLPGLKKDDVKVELADNVSTISGERKEEKEEKREGYYRSERSYGIFYRRIPLPESAKTDTATAKFSDDVLEITMQAPEREPRARELEIKEGKEAAIAKAAAAK